MAALEAAAPVLPEVTLDVASIPGLMDALRPADAGARAAASGRRADGRALGVARPVRLDAVAHAAPAADGVACVATSRARIGRSSCVGCVAASVASADEALLAFRVSRGALAADEPWARRVERLLDDAYASDAAFDRAILDCGSGAAQHWRLEVSVTCESDDGAAADAAVFAAAAALDVAALPAFDVEDGAARPSVDGAFPRRPAPVLLSAAPLTCAVAAGGAVLADPTTAEAVGATAVTVIAGAPGPGAPVRLLLKVAAPGGPAAVPAAALDECAALALARAGAVAWPSGAAK